MPGGDEAWVGRAELERGAIEILREQAGSIGRLVEVEDGAPEGQWVLRVGDAVARGGCAELREAGELAPAPLGHEPTELGVVVGEVEEGRRGQELLPLEEERRLR